MRTLLQFALVVALVAGAVLAGAGLFAVGGAGIAAALGVLAVVLLPLAFAVSFTYHVAYYRRRRPGTTGTSDTPSSAPSNCRPSSRSGR